MKKIKELYLRASCSNLSVSFTYQHVNDFSVEIHVRDQKAETPIFYTDGHIEPKKAIKKALKFISKYEKR